MGTKFTLASNTTTGDRLANVGGAALHLSTGDLVMLVNDPSQTDPNKISLQLVPGTAHTTPQTIATISWQSTTGATFMGPLAMCRDANDNIYIAGTCGVSFPGGATAGSGLCMQAFKKGSGLTWTAQTACADTPTPSGGGMAMTWANTGTGTNSGGYLVIIMQEGGTTPRLVAMDAGGVMASLNNPFKVGGGTVYLTGSAATHINCVDVITNTFGATTGVVVYESASNTVKVESWSVNSSGAPSNTALGTHATGTLSATTKFGCYSIQSNVFAVAYPSSSNAGQISVLACNSTGSLGSPVDTGTSSNFPAPSASLSWDCATFASELWVYGWSSAAATTMLRCGFTFSTATPPAVTNAGVSTDDTSLGTTNTTIRAVNQPIDNSHTDYQWYETTTPFGLMGDFSALPATPNAPLLSLPVNNDIEYLAGGYTFSWAFQAVSSGDAQTAYAFKRQASGGSVQWWNGTTWQGSEIYITTATNSVAFPSTQWTVGTTYTWTVATKGSTGSASAYSGWYTIYSAQTLPSTPTLTASYDSNNNRVTLVVAGTGTDVAEFQVSRDGGTTWADVRNNGAVAQVSGAATVYDYEAQPGLVSTYRVRQTNTSQAPYGAPSAWSATQTVTPSLSTFWLRNPTDGSIGQAVYVKDGSWSTQITELSATHQPLGASKPIVLADTLKGEDGTCTFMTKTNATETTLLALMKQQNTLLLMSNDNRQWYIRFNQARQRPTSSGWGTATYKEWNVSWVEVAAP